MPWSYKPLFLAPYPYPEGMEGHACFQPVLNPTNAEKVQGKTNTLYMTALTLLAPSYPKFFANLDNYTVYTKCNDLPGVHSFYQYQNIYCLIFRQNHTYRSVWLNIKITCNLLHIDVLDYKSTEKKFYKIDNEHGENVQNCLIISYLKITAKNLQIT